MAAVTLRARDGARGARRRQVAALRRLRGLLAAEDEIHSGEDEREIRLGEMPDALGEDAAIEGDDLEIGRAHV